MKSAPLTEELYNYVVAHRSNAVDPIVNDLTAETAALGDMAMMQIAPEQGTLLTLLVAALGVKSAIEVGTFTGTSALHIARGLSPGGKLLCLDQSTQWTQIAHKYWKRAGVEDRIELVLGDARETVAKLGDQTFDFAFIDADKTGYDAYYEAILPRMKTGGLLIFDNMLRGGRVVAPQTDDDRAIVALNAKLAGDPRVESVLLPVADGLNICRKK